MKTLPSALFACALLFCSCQSTNEPKEKNPQQEALKQKLPSGSLVIGNPLDCGIDGVQIFPVGGNYNPEIIVTDSYNKPHTLSFSANVSTTVVYDTYANSEYINTDENEYDIRNILFYSLKDGSTRVLFSDRVHILSFSLHKEYPIPLIYYRVVKKDINNDSIYNSRDAVSLYISKLNGDGLVQVTPDDEQYKEYFYYAGTHSILAKSIINVNQDSVFNNADETNFRSISLVKPAMGKEIFARSLRDSLRMK